MAKHQIAYYILDYQHIDGTIGNLSNKRVRGQVPEPEIKIYAQKRSFTLFFFAKSFFCTIFATDINQKNY